MIHEVLLFLAGLNNTINDTLNNKYHVGVTILRAKRTNMNSLAGALPLRGFLFATLFLFVMAANLQSQHTNACDSPEFYTVQKGDFLYNIANTYGDSRFWEPIYVANADQMADPNLIFPGQKIQIPSRIASFSESGYTAVEILKKPFCDSADIALDSVNETYLVRYRIDNFENDAKTASSSDSQSPEDTITEILSDSLTEEEKLEEFRKAFESIVESQKETEPESADTEKEKVVRMEVDGMILDETITKMGRDFYNIFYQFWQQPPEAYNFTIKISEQPAPTLGTMVSVTVNDTKTFQSRLQPRFDFIEDAGKQAVRISYNYLKNNKEQFIIY